MPQPFKGSTRIGLGRERLAQRPEHLKCIGHVTTEWALVEMQLFDIFVALCGGISTYAITGTIFDTLESLTLRLNLIGKFIRMRAPNLVDEFEQVIGPQIRKTAGYRNTVAHGKWGTSPKHPEDLLLVKMTGDVMRYNLADLEAIIDRIINTQSDVGTFFVKVTNSLETK